MVRCDFPKKPKDIVGKWITCTWNGMQDVYKVLKATDKTVTLQEYMWTTVSPLPGETAYGNPTWCTTVIKQDASGFVKQTKPKFFKNKEGKLCTEAVPNVIQKRVHYVDNGFTMKTSWNGFGFWHVIANNDEEAKKLRWSTFWN